MISVIVPVYNVERYLRQCLDSIINQTYRDIDILLIDDGSTDRCGDICDEYARVDHRIRVFHTQNKGLSAARNLGLREAKGDYIGFVDSDDWVEPNMYEVLLRQLEKNRADISVCELYVEYINMHQAGRIIQDAIYVDEGIIRALVYNSFYNLAWNKLYKKFCWDGLEFPNGVDYEDDAIIYKTFLKAHSVVCTSIPLCHYRMRKSSIMNKHSMKSFIDYWNSNYNRYLHLSEIPAIKRDQKCINKLEQSLAEIIIRIWKWVHYISKEQRDYVFLHNISSFVQKHFPFFGNRDWNLALRIRLFFSKYSNDYVFAFLYALNSSRLVILFEFYE